MKKIILFVVVLFLIIILAGGYYIWSNKDTIVSDLKDTIETKLDDVFKLPEYGKKEYIRSRYGQLLQALDEAAANSKSVFKFGAYVEEMKLPEEVVYIGITKGEEKTDIIKRFNWSGHSFTTKNKYGAGTLKGSRTINIMSYENTGPYNYMDSFIVYIEYTEDVNNKTSELEG